MWVTQFTKRIKFTNKFKSNKVTLRYFYQSNFIGFANIIQSNQFKCKFILFFNIIFLS